MKALSLRFSAVIAEKLLFLAIVLLVGVASVFAQAQASTADLRGVVSDPSGAVVPGATVTVRSPATGINRSVTTNDEGTYQVFALPPGEYEISAEAATF